MLFPSEENQIPRPDKQHFNGSLIVNVLLTDYLHQDEKEFFKFVLCDISHIIVNTSLAQEIVFQQDFL
jgi:hypothetical protein